MLFINFFSKYQSFENKGGTLAVSFILIVVMSLKNTVMMATLNTINNHSVSCKHKTVRGKHQRTPLYLGIINFMYVGR